MKKVFKAFIIVCYNLTSYFLINFTHLMLIINIKIYCIYNLVVILQDIFAILFYI